MASTKPLRLLFGPHWRIVTAIATTVIILALALGLGLGLGLKHHRHHNASQASQSTQSLPFLTPQTSNNFTVGSIVDQSPQDRKYNFTISLANGAPDGVNKTMLVVNAAPFGAGMTCHVPSGFFVFPVVVRGGNSVSFIVLGLLKGLEAAPRCMYPGPTLEVNQGDRLIVKVQNNLPNATSIHWHGLVRETTSLESFSILTNWFEFQNGTNWYDGTSGVTECGIPPGQSLTYKYINYHGHMGASLSVNFPELLGITPVCFWSPLHVTPLTFRVRLYANLGLEPDRLCLTSTQMADLYHDQSQVLLADYLSVRGHSLLLFKNCNFAQPEGIEGQQGNEPVPDGGTINGLGQYSFAGTGGSYFDYTVERNKTYRIRLINSGSFPTIRFSVDNHPLTLIEADGTLLAPTQVSGIVVAVAQRYSVLLTANQTSVENGTFWIRATLQTDMFLYQLEGQNVDIRGVIRYSDGAKSGVPGDPASADPGPGISGLIDVNGTSSLTPLEPSPAPNATRATTRRDLFQTAWALVQETSYLYGGLDTDNLDDGDHPFHLHGHRPWIMGSGAGRYSGQELNATSPLRRDTVLIPAYSWTVLRFVTDNPGVWAFHCHIAWHMAAGLLMQISSQPSVLSELTVPEDIVTYWLALPQSGLVRSELPQLSHCRADALDFRAWKRVRSWYHVLKVEFGCTRSYNTVHVLGAESTADLNRELGVRLESFEIGRNTTHQLRQQNVLSQHILLPQQNFCALDGRVQTRFYFYALTLTSDPHYSHTLSTTSTMPAPSDFGDGSTVIESATPTQSRQKGVETFSPAKPSGHYRDLTTFAKTTDYFSEERPFVVVVGKDGVIGHRLDITITRSFLTSEGGSIAVMAALVFWCIIMIRPTWFFYALKTPPPPSSTSPAEHAPLAASTEKLKLYPSPESDCDCIIGHHRFHVVGGRGVDGTDLGGLMAFDSYNVSFQKCGTKSKRKVGSCRLSTLLSGNLA
ncbi:hypothetical protein BGY98DRAFT_937730 [Russula aff. rugulosa BPL654]|nr:hypothetical protein BGY98DRAFT_937730 [Russula aff. rugulosa BPL654]